MDRQTGRQTDKLTDTITRSAPHVAAAADAGEVADEVDAVFLRRAVVESRLRALVDICK